MQGKFPIRKIIVYAIYILLFTTFQVSFPNAISFRGQVADLTFAFVVLTGYYYGFLDGAVVGLITGMIRDCFASPIIMGLDGKTQLASGIGMLVLFLAGSYGSSFFKHRLHRNVHFALLAVLSATLIYKVSGHICIFLWLKLQDGAIYTLTLGKILTDSILPSLLVNVLAALPIIFLLRFLGPVSRRKSDDSNDDVIKSYGEDSWLQI
ncbi:MAG: hypothetical protein K5745_03490 [Saccharofermentans sp.]|nr:hypothetical protein [Saccharofermentans sp.]